MSSDRTLSGCPTFRRRFIRQALRTVRYSHVRNARGSLIRLTYRKVLSNASCITSSASDGPPHTVWLNR